MAGYPKYRYRGWCRGMRRRSSGSEEEKHERKLSLDEQKNKPKEMHNNIVVE